jgi:hypothetical protein
MVAAIEYTILGRQRHEERGAWSAAIALTVILHALVVAGIAIFRPFTPDPVQARSQEPIPLVFVESPKAQEEPAFFSELPEEMADTAPEKPDFLSNIDSRARDASPGGEGSLPRLEGASDAPHVALVPGETSPANPKAPEEGSDEATEPAPDAAALETPAESPGAEAALVPRKEERAENARPFDPSLLLARPRGNSDIAQEAMNNPDGGTPLDGGITLNTVAWDYAPWIQRFRRDFLRDWRAPYAYYMGLISGWHVLELEVAPGGELLRLELRNQEGSDALVQTSELTFKALAPYHPLPEDFPEESLVLRIKLVYPKVPQRTR